MEHLARADRLNRGHQRLKERPVTLNSVLLHVYDHDSESNLTQILLEFEARDRW